MCERRKLAGRTLSLPATIVIVSVLAWKKPSVHVGLVVAMVIITGQVFGMITA